MIRIILSGACGKMGRAVAELVSNEPDCRIVAGVDVSGATYSYFPVLPKIGDVDENADVVIDFSHPSALSDTLDFCKSRQVPVVIATTGHCESQVAEIKAAKEVIPIFFTGNMSLGINLMSNLARRAAQVLGNCYDIEIIEKHHNRKVDAPSGTALMLAAALNEGRENALSYTYDRHCVRQSREKNEMGIHSIRGGTIVGEHEIIFAGHDEILTLSHSALSREVFASGALNAALFLANKKGERGLFDMGDLV
ncbi:MAG: 4-hydroxy-tetrahydrodipicolinate reductase [Oscillospiraceae bacterium]|nr:4-hydroxy-tetrahydrodipicolinate reductase [Oscillospiraceae bacterium]